MVDRVLDVQQHHSIRARKLTSRTEPYWTNSGGRMVMPAPLILESLCQAAAWLLMIDSLTTKRAALLSVAEVEFATPVQPGDVLELTAVIEGSSSDVVVVGGTVETSAALVLRASGIMCKIMEADALEDPASTRRRQHALTRVEL